MDTTEEVLLLHFTGNDRPGLGQHLQSQQHLGRRRSAVFLLLDGKREALDRLILDAIYPAGNRFVALDGERGASAP